MVISEAPDQRLPECWPFPAESATREVGKHRGIRRTSHERLEHRAARAQHVTLATDAV